MTPLRVRLGQEIFRRVAGPDGPRARERIHGTAGPRWFDADSEIVRVHGDASMFIGGMRALLLQTLHPAAMRAVSEHSGFRGDMWGRLARTAEYIGVTTYGTTAEAMLAAWGDADLRFVLCRGGALAAGITGEWSAGLPAGLRTTLITCWV